GPAGLSQSWSVWSIACVTGPRRQSGRMAESIKASCRNSTLALVWSTQYMAYRTWPLVQVPDKITGYASEARHASMPLWRGGAYGAPPPKAVSGGIGSSERHQH